jgi:cytochrome P450
MDLFHKRKDELKRGIDTERGDLLIILATDEFYRDKDEEIIDECIALYLGGSTTTSVATSNMI